MSAKTEKELYEIRNKLYDLGCGFWTSKSLRTLAKDSGNLVHELIGSREHVKSLQIEIEFLKKQLEEKQGVISTLESKLSEIQKISR